MKLRPFELGLVVGFTLLFLMALVILRTYESPTDSNTLDLNVTVWGTLPADTFEQILTDITDQNKSFDVVSYRYIDPRNFDETFLNLSLIHI